MRTDRRESGQALVEFSLAFIVFIVMVLGLFDLGRGVYMYNGVSEAAREIARRTVVHPGIVLGASTESQNTVATQKGMIPELGNPTYACVDVAGNAVAHVPCQSGDYVRVTTSAVFSPISPLGIGGPITLTASASMLVP